MIQLTGRGLVISSEDEVGRLAETFAQSHCVKLEGLLEPSLLQFVSRAVETAPFERRVHEGLNPPAVDMCLADEALLRHLLFVFNDEGFFNFIDHVTGCGSIGSFFGNVYRIEPETDQYDSWHNDLGDDRLIALSLNLSPAGYTGGVLQIRDVHTKLLLHEAANTRFGDAIAFRLDKDLQHRVSEVGAGPPRTAFAGWFHRNRCYVEAMKARRPV